MDINETARQLGISPDGVRKRIARGTLQGTKAGARWDIVLDTGQDKTGPRPGQQDRTSKRVEDDKAPPGGTQVTLVTSLQDQIASLQEQLRVMNQALSYRDNQITELVAVVRQQQAMISNLFLLGQ